MPEETSRHQPAPPTSPSTSAGREAPSGEDILAIIRNVESQLDQLKQAKTDQERMLQTLLHQQSDLEQQDHQLVGRAKRLEEREERVRQAEAREAERAAEIDRRAAEIAGAEQELAEQGRHLAEREEALAVREREAIEQQQAFESQFAEILEQAQAFKSDRADFARARAELEGELDRLRERGVTAMHVHPFAAIVEQLEVIARPGDLLVVMGAGPVWTIARDFMDAAPAAPTAPAAALPPASGGAVPRPAPPAAGDDRSPADAAGASA